MLRQLFPAAPSFAFILLFGALSTARAQATVSTFALSVSAAGSATSPGTSFSSGDNQRASFSIMHVPSNVSIPVTFTFTVKSQIDLLTQPGTSALASGSVGVQIFAGNQASGAQAAASSFRGSLDSIGTPPNGPIRLTSMVNQTFSVLAVAVAGGEAYTANASSETSASVTLTNISVPWSVLLAYPQIQIRQQIDMPDPSTDTGLLELMLIGENLFPGRTGYDASQTLTAMQAMKACIYNRLNNDPAQFAAPDATTVADILWADQPTQQFPEFLTDPTDGTRSIDPGFLNNVASAVANANNGNQSFLTFVQMAQQVARQPVNDPFAGITQIGSVNVTGGTYFWRPVTSPNPGTSRAIPIPATMGGQLSGTSFFTLASP